MDWQWVAWPLASLFALVGLVLLLLIPLGLPGTWLLLGVAALVELVDGRIAGDPARVTFGWPLLAGCAALALIGEGIEALAGIAGTHLGGGTRRGMVGAFVGGIAGAILLTPVIPIPLVGTLVGALLGTFAGAWIGEATGPLGRGHRANLRAAFAASVGRLGGTLGKLALGVVAWLLLVRAAMPL